ncbi:MAG: carboxylate-amine ligase [Pseudomonadota bacterium]
MSLSEPPFTLGIEEEYLLVDRATGDLATDPPEEIFAECEKRCSGQVSPEYMRCQIEIGTRVCANLKEARQDLACLRSTVVEVAEKYDLAPIAASSHPFARWESQKTTPRERYQELALEMQAAARRMLISGMHVHVGIDDDELRIDLMNQLGYFLPHLLALSTSSPFWNGENTGLKSYRLTVFDALPRTGLPERFSSYAEYQRHVQILIDAKLIQDSSKIWWDLRPSARYPTLETRVMDVCTRLDDAIAIAALIVCLLRMLYRLRLDNQRWRTYTQMLINENRWRAMRYSFDEGLIDLAKGQVIDFDVILGEILELIAEDAKAFDCEAEIARLPKILNAGTSAHRQIEAFEAARAEGKSQEEALRAVVNYLIATTQAGY